MSPATVEANEASSRHLDQSSLEPTTHDIFTRSAFGVGLHFGTNIRLNDLAGVLLDSCWCRRPQITEALPGCLAQLITGGTL